MNNNTGDSERSKHYQPPQWRNEMLETMRQSLTEREQELLINGADSLSSSWRLQSMKRRWDNHIHNT